MLSDKQQELNALQQVHLIAYNVLDSKCGNVPISVHIQIMQRLYLPTTTSLNSYTRSCYTVFKVNYKPSSDYFLDRNPASQILTRDSSVSSRHQFDSCNGEPHAASSGFLASPNPIAAILFARASGKGLL